MPIWVKKMRARRRIGQEERLLELQRRIRGVESESSYLREMSRACAAESAASPDAAHDLRMAQLTDELRRNSEFLRSLIGEELRLRRKLGKND